ncbi:DUF4397 domain-containing protein [Niallia sp.]|uniref:DUF4397 domain-containing protein n=1 Tax=Niallia sp. TaxID=2837523 RepID=UPI0028999D44|nr:DUF4397 domain-containing protein [Niallia sp.]
MPQDHHHSIQEAGMYNVLSDYYKYTNPELHVYYYHKHLQSLKHVFSDDRQSAVIPDIQRQKEYGKIRILHAAINTATVDIFINSMRMFKEVSYKTMSNELTLPAGTYQIDIYETGKMIDSLCSQKIHVESNVYHTFAFSGMENRLKVQSFPEYPVVPPHETKLRFVQLADNLPTIDVAVQKGDVVFPSINYNVATSYLGLYPMSVYLEARISETKKVIQAFPPLRLEADKTYTAFIVKAAEDENCELLLFSC